MLGLVACAAPQAEAGVSRTVLAELRRLADTPCPSPPWMYTVDMAWYVGVFGRVVAIDGEMLAVRPDDQATWGDRDPLGLVIVSTRTGDGIKGDGIVLGACEGMVLCRYFPRPEPAHGEQIPESQRPRLGDQASFDHATTRTLRSGPVTNLR